MSHPEVFRYKGVLKKLTEKHLCQSPFFNKFEGSNFNFMNREILKQTFSCEFCKNFKQAYFEKRLRMIASKQSQ